MRSLYHLIDQAFDEDEIAHIISIAAQSPKQAGTVFSTSDSAQTIRISTISWLNDKTLKDKLWHFVQLANNSSFDVEVSAHADMQFTCYEARDGGHYDWHHDVNWASQDDMDRKISLTIQLSCPDSYEGGDFEFEEIKSSANFRGKGSLLLFPSYLSHRVTPVTKGTRLSLVAWFCGPRWR